MAVNVELEIVEQTVNGKILPAFKYVSSSVDIPKGKDGYVA